MTTDPRRGRRPVRRLGREPRAWQERRTRTEADFAPGSIYEAVTRSMVDNLADDVRDIRNRINGLFWLLAGTVAADIVMKAMGVGS